MKRTQFIPVAGGGGGGGGAMVQIPRADEDEPPG
jgi:hypothetical protein